MRRAGLLNKNQSVNDIIKNLFYWNTYLGYFVSFFFLTLISLGIFWSDQKNGCAVTLSLFHQYSGSISRELELANPSIAHANFIVFTEKLKTLSSISQIDLNILSSTKVDTFPLYDQCSNKILYSNLKIPIKFSNRINGFIVGYVSYFNSLPSIFSLWLISFFLIIYLKQVESKIRSRIDHDLIEPITNLSLGRDLEGSVASVAEVFYINANIIRLKQKIILNEKNENEIFLARQLSELAQQVSHDIRSPLSALNMMLMDLKELPEQKRVIVRSALQRINDISNSLLEKCKGQAVIGSTQSSPSPAAGISVEATEVVLLSSLLDELLSEKRIQFREKVDVRIEGDLTKAYGYFSSVNATELKRVLSNLINNSIEAFPEGKKKIQSKAKGYKNPSLHIDPSIAEGLVVAQSHAFFCIDLR